MENVSMCNKMLCLEIQYPYYDAIHAMVTNVNKSIKKKKNCHSNRAY